MSVTEDIDPDTAADAIALEDAPTTDSGGSRTDIPGPSLPGPSASDSAGSDSGGLLDKLLSTEPAPDLREVEDPWNPEQGGPTRIYRGLMKMGDLDGMPAIADIVIGILETVTELDTDSLGDMGTGSDSGGSGSGSEPDEPRGAPPGVSQGGPGQ